MVSKSNFQTPLVSGLVRITTLMAIIVGIVAPAWIGKDWLTGFVFALILLGIPHGASDYLVFRLFSKAESSSRIKWQFYGLYAAIMAIYGLLWLWQPPLAFALFIGVSIYHFGQSNWHTLPFRNAIEARLIYMLWGGFVLAFPILIHHEEAAVIVQQITGSTYLLDSNLRQALLFLSLFGNLIVVCHLNERGILSDAALGRELINLLLLAALFAFTPLLIGFAVYFVVWHSLAATLDQIGIFRQLYRGAYSSGMYWRQVIPMSLVALAGLAGLYYFSASLPEYPHFSWGTLFLFISIITVPHALLVDRLYERALLAGTTEAQVSSHVI